MALIKLVSIIKNQEYVSKKAFDGWSKNMEALQLTTNEIAKIIEKNQ